MSWNSSWKTRRRKKRSIVGGNLGLLAGKFGMLSWSWKDTRMATYSPLGNRNWVDMGYISDDMHHHEVAYRFQMGMVMLSHGCNSILEGIW